MLSRRYIIALWAGFFVIVIACAIIVYVVFGPAY